MKKVKITALQEILASHLTTNQDYVESALGVFTNDLLQISSGVISSTGLEVTQTATGTISVSTGYIYQDSVFGHLESASGITLSLPSSGSRTDLIVAYYDEVDDTSTSGYVLLDVSSGNESIQELPSRRFGAAIIEQLTSTSYATRPSNKIPLAEITLTTAGIGTITDVRVYSKIMRLQEDFQQNYHSMFFAGF